MQRGQTYWREGIKVVSHDNLFNLLSQMCSSCCTDLSNLDIEITFSNSNTKNNDSELPSPRRLGVHGGRMASICTVEGQRPRPTQEPNVLWRCEVVLQYL